MSEPQVCLIPSACGIVATIDAEDFDMVSAHTWHAQRCPKTVYFKSNDKPRILLHRLILGAPDGVWVDHRDRDGLNNRRPNLRLCNPSQNTANRTWKVGRAGYRGVRFAPRGSTSFEARVGSRWVGTFRSAVEAARARDLVAIEMFGEFAVLNFPAGARA